MLNDVQKLNFLMLGDRTAGRRRRMFSFSLLFSPTPSSLLTRYGRKRLTVAFVSYSANKLHGVKFEKTATTTKKQN